jgi:hypothetical protein
MNVPATSCGHRLSIHPGDHVCAIVSDRRERDRLSGSFLRDGLTAGYRCFFKVPERDPWQAAHAVGGGIDVNRCRAERQLELLGDSYHGHVQDGCSMGMIVGLWHDVLPDTGDGFPTADGCAETAWWRPRLPDTDTLTDYEAELNVLTETQLIAVLCLYQGTRHGGALVLDLMRTHSRLVIGKVELHNPYHRFQEDLRAPRRREHHSGTRVRRAG